MSGGPGVDFIDPETLRAWMATGEAVVVDESDRRVYGVLPRGVIALAFVGCEKSLKAQSTTWCRMRGGCGKKVGEGATGGNDGSC